MHPEDLRRWAEDRRAAELREHAAVRDLGPVSSANAGLELIQLAAYLHGWPLPIDPQDDAEDARVREDWHRLRLRWRSG
jgi:hypothetical protein